MHSVLLWDWHCARRFFRNEFFRTCQRKRVLLFFLPRAVINATIFTTLIGRCTYRFYLPVSSWPCTENFLCHWRSFLLITQPKQPSLQPVHQMRHRLLLLLQETQMPLAPHLVLSVRKSLHLVFDFRIVRVQQSSLSHMLMWCSMTTTEDWQLILGICPLYDTI